MVYFVLEENREWALFTIIGILLVLAYYVYRRKDTETSAQGTQGT
jgi:hypothetical protein